MPRISRNEPSATGASIVIDTYDDRNKDPVLAVLVLARKKKAFELQSFERSIWRILYFQTKPQNMMSSW